MTTKISDLKTKGFVSVSYPQELREAVDATYVLWKKFCDLPIEVKQTLPYSNAGAGVGYELKDGLGNKADRKENFDVSLGGVEWLRKNGKNFKDPVVLEFLHSVTSLVGIMKSLITDFAQSVEKEYRIEDFKKEVEQSESAFFVRFIHYFGNRNEGEEIASPHADQSGFTLHLFESDPGLQRLTLDTKGWIDMPVSEGETVIIPSMQLQLRSEGQLKALCHRVIATSETAKTGRYSAVCFVQLKNTSIYDKDRHGRLQEKEPGFNYDFSKDDFIKLFKN